MMSKFWKILHSFCLCDSALINVGFQHKYTAHMAFLLNQRKSVTATRMILHHFQLRCKNSLGYIKEHKRVQKAHFLQFLSDVIMHNCNM